MEEYHGNTLVIKHLPQDLSVEDRVDFLKHLGATEVWCVVSPFKKTSLTFAQFKCKERCRAVLKSLHQKKILGSLVSVEFSKDRSEIGQHSQVVDDATETTLLRKLTETYLKKLNSWTNSADFSQPPPANISYSYPPPSSQVLKNICSVLANVPKFYTQVLHLMNKMNLPCPFSENFEMHTDLLDGFEEPMTGETTLVADSEEESEIESDHETKNDIVSVPKPQKHPLRTVRVSSVVKSKRTSEKRIAVRREEVFETAPVRAPKKIELKVSTDLSLLADTEKVDNIGVNEPITSSDTKDDEEHLEKDNGSTTKSGVISLEELELNRIPSKDFYLLPVFKNYQPGPATCRLYIKNLAKTVTTGDLDYIFGRYRVEESSDQESLYNIRLMQEGRMKGQAFVTLQSVELAEKAVQETNGYILKGKAVVVQFARSTASK